MLSKGDLRTTKKYGLAMNKGLIVVFLLGLAAIMYGLYLFRWQSVDFCHDLRMHVSGCE